MLTKKLKNIINCGCSSLFINQNVHSLFHFFFVFRQSGRNVMTPIDFDVRSNASRVSKVSKSSKGTSYKDMGGSRRGATNKGSSSYKNMNGAGHQNKGIKWAP